MRPCLYHFSCPLSQGNVRSQHPGDFDFIKETTPTASSENATGELYLTTFSYSIATIATTWISKNSKLFSTNKHSVHGRQRTCTRPAPRPGPTHTPSVLLEWLSNLQKTPHHPLLETKPAQAIIPLTSKACRDRTPPENPPHTHTTSTGQLTPTLIRSLLRPSRNTTSPSSLRALLAQTPSGDSTQIKFVPRLHTQYPTSRPPAPFHRRHSPKGLFTTLRPLTPTIVLYTKRIRGPSLPHSPHCRPIIPSSSPCNNPWFARHPHIGLSWSRVSLSRLSAWSPPDHTPIHPRSIHKMKLQQLPTYQTQLRLEPPAALI